MYKSTIHSRHKILMTKNRIKLVCVGNWVFSFGLVTFLNAAFANPVQSVTRCQNDTYVPRIYLASIFIPTIIIPLIIVLVLYGRMACLLKRRSIEMASMTNQVSQSSAEASKNVTKLAFFVTGKCLSKYPSIGAPVWFKIPGLKLLNSI